MTFIARALLIGVTIYGAIVLALWVFQASFIYPAPGTLAPANSDYEEILLKTSDGLALRAHYREAQQGLPTIVYFHGNGGTLQGASVSNGALIEAGIGVLLVEYRGYGGNPGEASEAGFYRDGEAAMAHLLSLGIEPEQTIIIGNSIGSGVATEMATRHDAGALILIAPFTSLPDAAASNMWWLPASSLVRDQYDNAAKIGELTMPLLIQHGDNDNLVPFDHGQSLAQIARNATFQPFDGSGHDLSFERRSQEARRDWILALTISEDAG